MDYLRSFLGGKRRAEKPLPRTDKTDKSYSVSFVSESQARADACQAALKAALNRIDNAAVGQPAKTQELIAKLVADRTEMLAMLAAGNDSETLRYALLDLERTAKLLRKFQ